MKPPAERSSARESTDRSYGPELLVVVAAAIAVYLNAIPNGFTLDDRPIIVDNATVHDIADQVRIWLTPYWPAGYGLEPGLYRPLTIFGFALQWSAGQGDPLFFHGVSIVLHAGCCVLVYLLVRHFAGRLGAFAGGVVFAVHPVHVEAVANVVGQAELLAAIWVLAACLLYVSRPRGAAPAPSRMALVLICYLLGMLAKEHAVVLPGLLLALDVAQGRLRESRYLRHAAGPALVLASGAAVYLVLRWTVLGASLAGDAPVNLGFLERPGSRLLTALSVWPEYLRLLFAPWRLSFTYDPGVLPPPVGLDVRVVAGGLLLLGLIGSVFSRRLWPAAGLGAAWFLVAILPVSNLILPIGTVLAERTLYLSSVALALWVGFSARALSGQRHRWRGVAWVVGILWVGALAGRTVLRNPVWASNEALVARGMETHPRSFRVQWFHALELWEQGDTVSSRRAWARALELYDRDAAFLTQYGRFLYATGDLARAETFLDRALHIRPGDADAQYFSGLVAIARGDRTSASEWIDALDRRGLHGLAQALADSLATALPDV